MVGKVLSPQEKRIEENHGKVSFAKGSRIQRLYDRFQGTKSRVDVQRARFFTESFKETERKSLVLRWAKALYHVAEKIDVVIYEDELLVGRVGGPGKYGLIYPELDGCFLQSFAKQAASRSESPFAIAAEDIQIIQEEIAPYWEGKTYYEDFAHSLPEDVRKITYEPTDLFTSRFIVNETSSMRSALQWVHDFGKGIDQGFETIKQEAEKRLAELNPLNPRDSIDKADFYRAIIIVADAIILWAQRYSDEAKRLAAAETDGKRRQELLEIARITAKVPRYPAESFYEAMQAQWFIQLFSRLEQKTGATISNGRMDQYLYPYYARDKAAGRLDKAFAKELFQCMWLGMAQYQDLYVSPAGVKFNEGYAHWEAVTIGGVDREGNDAVNDLTYILLENKRDFPLNYPDLAARIHAGSSQEYLEQVALTISDGAGFPKLLNDEEIIPLLIAKGADAASARDYAVSGCTEVRMPNLDTFTTPCAFLNLGAVLELTLRNGRMAKCGEELLTVATGNPQDFASYDAFEQAFIEQEKFILRQTFRQQYIANRIRPRHFASPLGSALHALCMKHGLDLHTEHIPEGIELGYFDFIGLATVADSLAAIKKNVYEDKTLTWAEVLAALDHDFDGFEAVRQRLWNSPSYGNNDPYVDAIAKRIDRVGAAFAKENSKFLGVNIDLRYVSQSANVPFGKVVGALPNGRRAGTALSDGSSASQGADVNGPTAVLLSNVHTKNPDLLNRASRLLNIKLSPSAAAGPDGRDKIIALIRAWCSLKLWHLQFNIINRETLLKAQAHPEQYRSLLVRVAGYSAYFVELSPDLQEDIIKRTEHELSA